MADLTDTLADSPLASEGFAFTNAAAVTETVTVSDAYALVVKPGGIITTSATATSALALTYKGFTSFTSSAKALDKFSLARPVSFTSSAVASDSWSPSLVSKIRESAKASDAIQASATLGLALVQGVKATDSASLSEVKSLSAQASATDNLQITYIAHAQVAENSTTMDAWGKSHQAIVSLNEVVQASDVPFANFNYSVILREMVWAQTFIELSGSTTTWAINARTSSITQYDGSWSFNSFASMGRKYIAASADGLYELDGARDDTLNVVSVVGSGLTQLNGTKFSGLKGVYMSVRGQGRYQLKLDAGDGREYIYQRQSNPGLTTTKFNMGKGLHARYMAWELSNIEGQDFDLDTLELVPMVSGRRVG